MRRREFIALLGGVGAWPFAAIAEQGQIRRIGVFMPANNAEGKSRLTAFVRGLHEIGWMVGQNIRIDERWGDGNADSMRKYATELVALEPEVILANSSATLSPLLQATRTIPIVFAAVADPVGAGYVATLSRPGGNATGFTPFEYSIGGKWLELLKELAPQVTRVAVLRDSVLAAGAGQFGAIQALSSSPGLELRPIDVRDAGEIERSIAAFAQEPNGGLIVTASPLAPIFGNLIISLAARHRLPTIYYARFYGPAGGLICYGPDFRDQFRRAASYVDRILKGEKPADLPVQAPTKHELVINLKTAEALGLDVPTTLLARANEVIE